MGGNRVTPLYHVEATLNIRNVHLAIDLLVVPSGCIKRSLILGRDFFVRHGIIVDASQERLLGTGSGGKWDLYFNNGERFLLRNIPRYCCEEVSVSQDEPILVEIALAREVDTRDEMYFCGQLSSSYDMYFSSEPGILQFSNQRATILFTRIVASQKTPTLKRGSQLGTVSTIVEVCVADDGCMDLEAIQALILSEVAVPNLADDQAKQVKDMLLRQAAALSSGGHDIRLAGVTKH